MGVSPYGLHCRVHRNGEQLLLTIASRHVHMRVHHARAREPLQILIVQTRSPYRLAQVNQTRYTDGHHWWGVPFGGDKWGALVARAAGTCDRFHRLKVQAAITSKLLQ